MEIKLTKITQTPKGKALYISGLEQPLVVSNNTIIQHKLVDGIILTPSQLEILKKESEDYLCDNEAARLLAMRAHSIGEFRTKLKQKKFSPDFIEKAVNKFKSIGALNDTKYARQLANNILERKPCGRSYLLAHLQRKMISRETAETVVDQLLVENDQMTMAIGALQKRWPSFERLELETARNKVYNYLSRRGFGYDTAKAAFEELYNRIKKETDY